MGHPGRIIADYYITCGKCEYGVHCAEWILKRAEAAMREQGWSKTRKYGWVCPDCKLTRPTDSQWPTNDKQWSIMTTYNLMYMQ